jgi:hypothetical protein
LIKRQLRKKLPLLLSFESRSGPPADLDVRQPKPEVPNVWNESVTDKLPAPNLIHRNAAEGKFDHATALATYAVATLPGSEPATAFWSLIGNKFNLYSVLGVQQSPDLSHLRNTLIRTGKTS